MPLTQQALLLVHLVDVKGTYATMHWEVRGLLVGVSSPTVSCSSPFTPGLSQHSLLVRELALNSVSLACDTCVLSSELNPYPVFLGVTWLSVQILEVQALTLAP